jgi:hypothetical protein
MYRRIQRYIRVFGREHVDIRVLDPARFVVGDLLADFLSAIGADGALASQLDVIRVNEGLSLEAALILNEINKRFPTRNDAPPNAERAADLIQWLAQIPGQPFRCPSAVFNKIEPLLADDLQWLRRTLDAPVFPTRTNWEEPSPNWSGDTLNSIAALINNLAAAARARNRRRGAAKVLDAVAASLGRWTHESR